MRCDVEAEQAAWMSGIPDSRDQGWLSSATRKTASSGPPRSWGGRRPIALPYASSRICDLLGVDGLAESHPSWVALRGLSRTPVRCHRYRKLSDSAPCRSRTRACAALPNSAAPGGDARSSPRTRWAVLPAPAAQALAALPARVSWRWAPTPRGSQSGGAAHFAQRSYADTKRIR